MLKMWLKMPDFVVEKLVSPEFPIKKKNCDINLVFIIYKRS